MRCWRPGIPGMPSGEQRSSWASPLCRGIGRSGCASSTLGNGPWRRRRDLEANATKRPGAGQKHRRTATVRVCQEDGLSNPPRYGPRYIASNQSNAAYAESLRRKSHGESGANRTNRRGVERQRFGSTPFGAAPGDRSNIGHRVRRRTAEPSRQPPARHDAHPTRRRPVPGEPAGAAPPIARGPPRASRSYGVRPSLRRSYRPQRVPGDVRRSCTTRRPGQTDHMRTVS
jgi:hypothetical protein